MTCSTIKDEATLAFDEVLGLKGNGEHGFHLIATAFTLETFRVAKCTRPGHREVYHLQSQ